VVDSEVKLVLFVVFIADPLFLIHLPEGVVELPDDTPQGLQPVLPVEGVLHDHLLLVYNLVGVHVMVVFEFMEVDLIPGHALVEHFLGELAPKFAIEEDLFVEC
jgi:hypothetical protein